MTSLLLKLFVKNSDDTGDPKVRTAYGVLSGIVGIICNALLCAGIQAARELGAKVVRISSSTANVPANALYPSRGFTRHRPIWLPYPGLPLPCWSNLWELEL